MPRHRIPDSTYSITTYDRFLTIAFQADVENFLLKFEKLSSLRFSDFASVWRDMKFSYINSGQQYYTLIRQFVENCFFVLKKFIVYPKNIFTEVGTLYLLYALYFKQLVKDWVKIRVTLDEYLKLQDLIKRLRQERQVEPLFCYAKLVTEGAFEYVFQKKPLAPETRYMKNFSDYCDDTFQVRASVNSKIKLNEKLNEDNFLERFTKVTTDYNQALAKFSVKNPSLGIFKSTIVEELHSTMDFLDRSTEQIESIPKDDSIYARRARIKDKAMSMRGSNRLGIMPKEESEESLDEEFE